MNHHANEVGASRDQPVGDTPLVAAWRRFRSSPLALVGTVILVLLMLSAIFAGVLAPYDPYKTVFTETVLPPSAKHWLGTDDVGRDVLSRLLYAGRYSLLVAFAAEAAALGIGLPLGAWAGWKGGVVDFVVMRLYDIIGAFPMLIFQIVLVSVLSSLSISSVTAMIAALSITSWRGSCWLMRSQVLSIREREYVAAARAIGATDWDIIRRHLIPNAMGPIIVSISFEVPSFIGAEAAMSFLGLGISPPTPTWGQMLNKASSYIQNPATWYLLIPPAVVLSVVLLAFQFVADGLRRVANPAAAGRN